MSKHYDISFLEKLTDIKAHTIRIWEQRYKLLQPERTPTNIRIYNDYHLQKILNVKILLDYGYKISEIAKMKDADIKAVIQNIIQTAPQTSSIVFEFIQNELILATEELNEWHFERTYLNAVNKYGIYKTIKDIVYPFLARIGVLWSIGEISPMQEHFASQIIVRKLQSAIDALDISTTSKKSYALFLLPGEYHQIPLLFAHFILRSHKKKTYYLGEDVPAENIINLIEEKKVDYLVTFLTAGLEKKILNDIKLLINRLPSEGKLILGGSQKNLDQINQSISSKSLILNTSIENFIQIL